MFLHYFLFIAFFLINHFVYCDGICAKDFVRYLPSDFEKEWVQNIESVQNVICDTIIEKQHLPYFRTWLNGMDEMKSLYVPGTCNSQRKAIENNGTSVYSFMQYKYNCVDPTHTLHNTLVAEAIEPLVGYLRDPRPICRKIARQSFAPVNAQYDLASKNYLLLKDRYCDVNEIPNVPLPRLIIVDMGSTTYLHSKSGPSQQYFVDTYKNAGFTKLERLLAWEAIRYKPNVFDQVPKEVLPHYQFFNHPCSGVKDDRMNPLRWVKEIAKPDDFVVVKLDVDVKDVEIPIVEQILEDEELIGLIDEFFWEHHSTIEELAWAWKDAAMGSMAEGYSYFRKLREKGIRSHCWV